MELEEYRREFLTLVRVVAESDREGTVPSFVGQAANSLLDAGVIPDYESCFYTGTGRRNRRIRVDGYALDDFDMTMYLLIADFNGSDEPETLTMTQAKTVFDRLLAFLDEALVGSLHKEMEISTPAYDLVENIRASQSRIRKYSFILLTDKIASERIETLPFAEIQGVPVEYHVWDMNRFFRVMESESGRDEIFIEFDDYIQGGIPCLEASSAQTDEYRSFLCVIPGNVLADIYDKYGSRLLEGNVRSFLSTKRAVNKKIRETILGQPKRYFAYNNGISATATDVEIEKQENGLAVSSVRGFQIVNGGQTTASISNARFKDDASLDNIYVQVKLTEVDPVLASSIIPDISRSSNSQNKVSEADFFSNHAFHIQMEKLSRRIFAPAVGGAQYETHWFYERANGQYLQEQSRMKKSEKNRFLMINPQKQKITKTDIAKVHNAWRGLPQKVSLGAQKNFAVFATWITDEWEKRDTQ
ncbi:MAG: AIPR family protein, partial [Bacillota bacterium]|nr:AIPR family protein [Bacillota bacterium]